MSNGAGVLAQSQRAIVNMYTLIALLYCAASTWLFYGVVGIESVGLVHALAFAIISVNYLALQSTKNYDIATHVILAVGTMVVSSLYATGGWAGTGFLWTFAYLPYAFFLASQRIAQLWVAVLVIVDLGLLGADVADVMVVPYTGIQHAMFYASLGVFLLCMFLFKQAVLRSEATAQKQANDLAASNKALGQREAELHMAQRVANLGSWTWEAAANQTTWSPQMPVLFGLGADDPPLTPQTFRQYLHPEDKEAFETHWARALTGVPVSFDVRIVRRGGQVRTLHSRVNPERDEAGTVVRVRGTSQDVTEAREAEQERQQSALRLQEIEGLKDLNRFKTQFLNTAAHELATPLTPIKLQLHALRSASQDGPPERRQNALNLLERNVLRLGALVQDLLEGAKLQSSQLVIERRPVDLAAIVTETVRSQAVVAHEKGVTLDLQAATPLWTEGDARRLSQVADNLLANAIKFTPPGKAVHVRTTRASGGVAVFVQDEGLGIAPEKVHKLFQPFSQVHDTSQQTRAGTGLGLYISKGIIEAHGGKVGVESQGLGHGATFWIVLPEGEPPKDGAQALSR